MKQPAVTTDRPGMTDVLIRPAVAGDLDALKDLWRATWHDSYGSRLGAQDLHRLGASIDDPAIADMVPADGGALIALDGETAVGSICFVERGPVAYVWGMYVLPARQRRGLGTALMRRAAGELRTAEWIDLSAVDDGALTFYRKLGFAEQGPGEVELFPGMSVPSTRLGMAVRDLRLSPPA